MRSLGDTDFYERHYSFYERPGAAAYDKPRYAAMAGWIKSSISPFEPSSILDAGCGRGWMMTAVRELYPSVLIEGVEPSEQESENARRSGLLVTTARVCSQLNLRMQYDLVYSTNVIEHTANPLDFLHSLGDCVREDGLIVIICPDSSFPSAEFMFSDQSYSFTPQQLMKLAEIANLSVVAWSPAPETASLKDKQLLILSKAKTKLFGHTPYQIPSLTPEELYIRRCQYVESYVRCDRYLLERTAHYETIYNFGASTWSFLLAAYCPNYWKLVSCCVIDRGNGAFQGKPVHCLSEIAVYSKDVFVLGVNPLLQPELSDRLAVRNVASICWDHIIRR